MNAAVEVALEYHSLGLNITPLHPGSKKPILQGWNKRPPASTEEIEQWFGSREIVLSNGRRVSGPCNLGILAGPYKGGYLAPIDVDNLKAWGQVPIDFKRKAERSWLVNTASGKHHIYTLLPNRPSVQGGRILFRKQHLGEMPLMVVAPPSTIGNKAYTFHRRSHEIEPFDFTDFDFLSDNDGNPIESSLLQVLLDEDPTNKESRGDSFDRPFGIPYTLMLPMHTGMEFVDGKLIPVRNRSRCDLKLITYLRSRDWLLCDVIRLFERYACPGSRFHDRAKEHGRKYVAYRYERCGRWISRNRRTFLEQLNSFERFVGSQRFAGTEIQRALAFTLITIARYSGSAIFGSSYRIIAEVTGIDKNTVSRNLPALIRLGYVSERKDFSTGYLRQFTFSQEFLDPGCQFAYSSKVNPLFANVPRMTLFELSEVRKHDAFRSVGVRTGTEEEFPSGLSKSGFHVFEHIVQQAGVKTRDILKHFGPSKARTVKRKLANLRRLGLLHKQKGRWFPVTVDADTLARLLSSAADRLGTSGAAQEQKKRHKIEREQYADWKTRRYRP